MRLWLYLFRQMLAPFLFIALAMTAVVWLSQSLRFVELIVNRGLSAAQFISLTAMLMPGFLSIVLPIAAFIGTLFAYQRLDVESEVVVMRAAGMGPAPLALPAAALGLLTAAATAWMTLVLGPSGFRAFKDAQFTFRGDYATVLLQEGAFNTLSDTLTVYVRARGSQGELTGILVHDSRDQRKPITMMAESGTLVRTDDGPRFLMLDGNRQEIDPTTGRLSMLYFDRYSLDLTAFADPTSLRWREPAERTLAELFNPGTGLDDQRNARRMRAEAHRRMAAPLYPLALTLIAAACVLAGQFSRRGRWQRLAIGSAIVIALEIVAVSLPAWGARHGAGLAALYLLPLGALGMAGWVLTRDPGPGRAWFARFAG